MTEQVVQAQLGTLIPKVMSVLKDVVQERVPETGRFKSLCVTFRYPGTKYQSSLWAEYDEVHEGGGCRLVTGMREEGSDRIVRHYAAVGSRAEILAWLEDEAHIPELSEDYGQLKQTVDKWD